jgi:prepilin peptidase CpaA
LIVLAVATVTDLHSHRIPNWLVLPFLLVRLGLRGWLAGWHGMLHSPADMGVGALFFGIVCWMDGIGMGDVKLCAAIGAWIGPSQMLTALVLTGIAGCSTR